MKENKSLKNPPILEGYLYGYKEAIKARDNNKLLCIRLETSLACNLRCEYCYRASGEPAKNEMSYDELVNIVDQARNLGAKSIVIIGGGEPTIYPHFMDLVSHIHSLKMVPVVITNNQTMSEDLADFLLKNNSSVMIKLDSLRDAVMNKLTGKTGACKRTKQGLKNLINVGYDKGKKVKLGASFVTTNLNLDEIETIWRFCRDRNIFPNMEIMTPNGRARNHFEWIPTRKQIKKIRLKLLEIDESEYGYTWVPYTPLTGVGCRQHEYSLCITVEGYARPCAAVLVNQINVRSNTSNGMTLSQALNDPFIRRARNSYRYLEGKCGECEFKTNHCIGCRGIAFTYGLLAGRHPFKAIISEDPYCSKEGKSKMDDLDIPEKYQFEYRC